jgi:endonuclease YncB( thermonuclease family)
MRAHINRMLRVCFIFVLCLAPVAVCADPSGRVQVIDADTWDVGGKRVRLYGIDAPELDQTCEAPDGVTWACGAWATDQVRQRFHGQNADCERRDIDRYGRIVARCAVAGQDVGRVLVSEGLAFAYRRYAMDYDLDEKAAAVNDRGLHASRIQSPAQFRASRAADADAPDPSCVIKGNISSKGARIYHVPGQEHYRKTRISTSRGERWFCSEADARAAGWRRSRR